MPPSSGERQASPIASSCDESSDFFRSRPGEAAGRDRSRAEPCSGMRGGRDHDAVLLARQRAGMGATFANLSNTTLGAGILSFPFAFSKGGYLGTSIFLVVMSFVSLFSSMALARAAAYFNCDTPSALVRVVLGVRFELFVNIAVILFGFGACCGYLLVIGDYTSEVLQALLIADAASATCSWPEQWYCTRQFSIVCVGSVIVLPLALLPTTKELARSSFLGILGITYTTILIGYEVVAGGARLPLEEPPYAQQEPSDTRLLWGGLSNLLSTTGIVVFAFVTQMQVPNILAEVRDPETVGGNLALQPQDFCERDEEETHTEMHDGEANRLMHEHETATKSVHPTSIKQSSNFVSALMQRGSLALTPRDARRVQIFDDAIRLQQLLVIVLYAIVGNCGYALFGPKVSSNILVSFPLNKFSVNVARVGVSIVGAVSYPMLHFTSRMMLHSMLLPASQRGQADMSRLRRWSLTLFFFAGTLLVSCSIDDLGTLWTIFGATCGYIVMFFVPACGLLSSYGPWRDRLSKACGVSMLVAGGSICGFCVATSL